MRVSNIQKWFFSEKAFRDQLRSWGWIYLFFASFSLLTGLISFGVTLRWFPISDMLRALLLDSLLTLPVMFLPGMLATGVLVLSFVPFFAATLSNVVHILLYHAPISTFAIQSIFETTSNEAREFATDFFSIPNALILMVVFVIPLFLLVKAVRARKRFSRPSLQWCVLALILCTPIAYSAVRKGPRLLASHGVYQFCTTLCRYTDEIRAVWIRYAPRDKTCRWLLWLFWMAILPCRVPMCSSSGNQRIGIIFPYMATSGTRRRNWRPCGMSWLSLRMSSARTPIQSPVCEKSFFFQNCRKVTPF